MNRKETRLLVESWRKLLNEDSLNTKKESEMIEEGKIANALQYLTLGIAAITANSANALTPSQVENGIEDNMPGVTASVSGNSLEIESKSGKTSTYKIPDTTGFEGSKFNEYLKDNLNNTSDWYSYVKGLTFFKSTDDNDPLRPLFPDGMNWNGAKFNKNLTSNHKDLIKKITHNFLTADGEIFTDSSGNDFFIGYNDDGAPVEVVKFNSNELEDLCSKAEKEEASKRKSGKYVKLQSLRKAMLQHHSN